MQLDNIATPQEDATPQLRYASLHRTVERGMASDEVLRELVEICLQLGHTDEAVRVHAGMRAGAVRDHVSALLVRRGLLTRGREPRPGAGSQLSGNTSASSIPSAREYALDAVQFLCQGHMPAIALMTMMAFPIVVGVGGFLTSGGSPWLFAGLAALPGLCVLGVVGAMGRQIFLTSAEGEEETPVIPAPDEMITAAKRYLTDWLIVLGALVAPSLTLLWFNAPLVSSLPGLLIGMFLTPMALILRQMRGDFGALSPVALVRGIGCCKGYPRIAFVFWVAFAPAAIAFWTSLGHAIWLQIAIVGPLAVLPMFGTARLLGTFTESYRVQMGLLLQPHGGTPTPNGPKPNAPRPTGARPAAPHKSPRPQAGPAPTGRPGGIGRRLQQRKHTPLSPRQQQPAPTAALGNMHPLLSQHAAPPAPPAPPVRAPSALARFAPQLQAKTPPPAPKPAPAKLPPKPQHLAKKVEHSTPQPATLARRPSPEDWMVQKSPPPIAQIEGRAPRTAPPKATLKSSSKPAAKAEATVAAAAQPELPVDSKGFAGPDLSNIPGATIISAEDRERLGAASRRE